MTSGLDFIAILCLNYNNTIGCVETNDLIFDIKEELNHFKNITLDTANDKTNVLIMGRNTWDSIKYKPLKNRMNFIISSNYEDINYKYRVNHNVISFPNNETCLTFIYDNKYIYDKVFIIGGISIYEYYLNNNIINKIICTKITTPNNFGNIEFNINYFNFFKINKLIEHSDVDAYNKISGEKIKLNYIVITYNKFSKIDINLIYNINSLTTNFKDDLDDLDDNDSNTSSSLTSNCHDENTNMNINMNMNNGITIPEMKNMNVDLNDELLFYISSSDESVTDNDISDHERNIIINESIESQTITIPDNNNEEKKNNILTHADSWTIINHDYIYMQRHMHRHMDSDNHSVSDSESIDSDKTYYF